jgi:signal transduction histidine kinase/ActR/RegA family two-component response regulator
MNRVFIFLSILIFLTQGRADAGDQSRTVGNVCLGGRAVGTIRFYRDSGGRKTLSEISSPSFADSFTAASSRTPNFGFSSAVYWARLDIHDTACLRSRLVLETGVPSIQNVDFYRPTDSGFAALSSGFFQRGSLRALPYLFPAFLLTPERSAQARTLFLRFKSQTSLLLPVSLTSEAAYAVHDRNIQNALGLYFGALLIMALYHLALFVYLKDRNYLNFVGFILTFAFGQIVAVYGFFIGQESSEFARHCAPFTHCVQFLAAVFGILFSRTILATRRFVPKTDRVLLACVWICAVMILASPALGFMNSERILVFANIVPPVFLMFGAIVALRRKYRPGLYFVQSGLITLASLVVYNLMYGFGVMPFSFPVYFMPNVSFILTILLFSVALADTIATMQQDRNRATAVALKNLRQTLTFKEEKVHLEEELFHAKKLELIGRLFSGICHDLRNILTPLHGYAELIKRKADPDSDVGRYADGLLSAAVKTRDLTVKLLDFTRKKPWKMVPIRCCALVDDVILLLRPSVKKNVVILKEPAVDKDTVLGDPSSIQNALINLGLNANDAMPDGGSIVFEIDTCVLAEGNPLLGRFEATAGTFVSISVSDSGIGIPAELHEKIFEPFFTTKQHGKGTGLGLASVFGCAKSHNGCVDVKSCVGSGSEFTLYMPLSDKVPVAAGESPPLLGRHKGQGTIMLIDDEEMVRTLMADILDDDGYSIVSFARCDEAVTHFRENYADFDCVIIDKILVDSDGIQCLRKLREINPDVRAVLMSGATDEISEDAVLARGFSAVVDKPFEMKMLLDTIRSVVSGQTANAGGVGA